MRLPPITLLHVENLAAAERPQRLGPHVAEDALGMRHEIGPVRHGVAAQVDGAVGRARARDEHVGQGCGAGLRFGLLASSWYWLISPLAAEEEGSAFGGSLFFEIDAVESGFRVQVADEDYAFLGAVVRRVFGEVGREVCVVLRERKELAVGREGAKVCWQIFLTCMWIWIASGLSYPSGLLWSASIHVQSEANRVPCERFCWNITGLVYSTGVDLPGT